MLFLFRIGSKPVLLIISFVLVIFFSACSNSSKNELTVFKALDESLINSNKLINKSTEAILVQLKEKTTDPAPAYRASIWYPKALMVKEESLNMTSYVEELKSALQKEAGLNNVTNSFKDDDKGVVSLLFKTNQEGKKLYEKLKQFKNNIFQIDSDLKGVFNNTMILTTQAFDTLNEKKQDINKVFFENIPVVAALATLSKFQNNIKIDENRIIQFCNNKVGSMIDNFETYRAIVGQSSSYVKAGDEIEITAGIGAFSKGAKPEILIDGKVVKMDEFGTAIYKFRTPMKPGKYRTPVRIGYTDQEGRQQYITKDVEYTVKD